MYTSLFGGRDSRHAESNYPKYTNNTIPVGSFGDLKEDSTNVVKKLFELPREIIDDVFSTTNPSAPPITNSNNAEAQTEALVTLVSPEDNTNTQKNDLKNKLYKCYNDNQLLVTVLVIIILFLLFNLINSESSMFTNIKSKFTSGMTRSPTRAPLPTRRK
jgi:hypothetical protein